MAERRAWTINSLKAFREGFHQPEGEGGRERKEVPRRDLLKIARRLKNLVARAENTQGRKQGELGGREEIAMEDGLPKRKRHREVKHRF